MRLKLAAAMAKPAPLTRRTTVSSTPSSKKSTKTRSDNLTYLSPPSRLYPGRGAFYILTIAAELEAGGLVGGDLLPI